MRAPFQVIVFPYKFVDSKLFVLIGKRVDGDYWQAISGGGENAESPLEAAKRELYEESGLNGDDWQQLDSMCMLPKTHYLGHKNWPDKTLVIPEYAFVVRCDGYPKASDEHSELLWTEAERASSLLKYDSNKIALWELSQRIKM
jgi:dATP pyrophosphohydrolase